MTAYAEHDALVVNNDDPEKRGRLKLSCGSLTDEGEELPWWIPPRFHYVDGSGGWFGIPEKYSWVKLFIAEDSEWDEIQGEQTLSVGEDAGMYWQCSAYNDIQRLSDIFKTNYPKRRGYVYPNGWAVFVDSKDNEMVLGYYPDEKRPPEAWIKMLKDHSVMLENSDGMKVHLLPSKILIESKATVEIVGTSVKIGGASATHPQVCGDVLDNYLKAEQLAFGTTHSHICAAPGVASGPPVPIMGPVPANLLSTKHKVEE
jgi:hypothetical protein